LAAVTVIQVHAQHAQKIPRGTVMIKHHVLELEALGAILIILQAQFTQLPQLPIHLVAGVHQRDQEAAQYLALIQQL